MKLMNAYTLTNCSNDRTHSDSKEDLGCLKMKSLKFRMLLMLSISFSFTG